MANRQILFITKSREAASTRYRVRQYVPALEAAGWQVRHLTTDGGWRARLAALRAASAAAVTVVCRRTFSSPYRLALRHVSRRLVFDFDDAIFRTPRGPSPGRARRFAAMVRGCDQVWTGNAHLAEQARRYARDVRVLPTAVDPAEYDVQPTKPTEQVDVVWIGSSSTRPYLESLLPALEAAAAQVAPLRLKIVADFTLTSSRLPIIAVPWRSEIEAAALASSHVGLAPMPDDGWTRGKCGLKVLQYMAARLPVVASDAGVHRELIEPGRTGLLVTDTEGWTSALATLAADPAKRAQMGEAGRQRVEAHYARAVVAERMLSALSSLVGTADVEVPPQR